MQVFRSLLILTALSWATAASAQLACHEIWAPVQAEVIDLNYVESIRGWNHESKTGFVQKLLGLKDGVLRDGMKLTVERFHKSREFRTWFERQNRVLGKLHESFEPAPGRTKLLSDPQNALAAKLLAVREAKYTVDVAYYILRNDQTGLSFMHEIRQAVRRGVNVRFLVDSTGTVGMAPHSELRALIEFAKREGGKVLDLQGRPTNKTATVEIVFFNPVSNMAASALRSMFRQLISLFAPLIGQQKAESLAYSLNRRSHDKILLIDGAFHDRSISFIGGRNMSDHYYGIPKVDEHTYIDFELMIRGVTGDANAGRTVGTQMTDYFDQIYFHLGNREISRSILGILRGYHSQAQKMQEAHDRTSENLGLNQDPEMVRESLLQLGFEETKVDIVHTIHNLHRTKASRKIEARDVRADVKNGQALLGKIEHLIAKENQEIVIISPYLWLSVRQIRLLKSWLREDPSRKLTILTNSIMTSDNMPAQVLVDNVIGPALMLDQGLISAKGEVLRPSISGQVKIYQYGHLDATTLGGTVGYGKMHAKGLLLKGSDVSVIGTYNNDPRSLLLNSEGAAIVTNPEIAKQFKLDIDRLASESHLWGSEEYHAIRAHKGLGRVKNSISEFSQGLYSMLITLRLWWLI